MAEGPRTKLTRPAADAFEGASRTHPWENICPNLNIQLQASGISTRYNGPKKYISQKKYDIKEISRHPDEFVIVVAGKRDSAHDNLTLFVTEYYEYVKGKPKRSEEKHLSERLPYVKEILDKLHGNIQLELPNKADEPCNETIGIVKNEARELTEEEKHIHCDYIISYYVPGGLKNVMQNPDTYLRKRWIFVPSYGRASFARLDYSKAHIGNDTIVAVVVRPYELLEYRRNVGDRHLIFRLPQVESGIGYARMWIQKIATKLGLGYCWMMDDSVKCIYEYFQDEKPEIWEKRKRCFQDVFKYIERKMVKEIGAISPAIYRGSNNTKVAFSCTAPQGMVYLNILALQEKGVQYRPELHYLEDLLFAIECESAGLKVYRCNRYLLQDDQQAAAWKKTGCHSPYQQVINDVHSSVQTGEREEKASIACKKELFPAGVEDVVKVEVERNEREPDVTHPIGEGPV